MKMRKKNIRVFGMATACGALIGLGSLVASPQHCLAQSVDADGDGFTIDQGDCNDSNAKIFPGALEICTDFIDNNCNYLIDMQDLECVFPCTSNYQCGDNRFCKKATGSCEKPGSCAPIPSPTSCQPTSNPVCGCDGVTYANACEAESKGINVASVGSCATTTYKWKYYFPSIKDVQVVGWENYLTIQAKDPVPMDVTLKVYNLEGTLVGTYIYSDTDPNANAPAIQPNARVAQKPSMIVGTVTNPIDVEGSVIAETSVPALATTNAIAFNFDGFSIYEAARSRSAHFFPKNFDGPTRYQVSLLVQNVYNSTRNVTIKLLGKSPTSPGHGVMKTYDIPPYGTLKVRPSELAGGIDFDGSAIIYSNLNYITDAKGLPVPAMCRYEIGYEEISIYDSTVPQPSLTFPTLKDGKFGGLLDFQNYLSVVNPGVVDATVSIYLYNKSGAEEGRVSNEVIPAGGKKTWRPAMIKGSVSAPVDFEGSAVVVCSSTLVGQTNTIYPGSNYYGIDAFDLFESAIPTNTLSFPKAFDNIVADNHLYDNYVYIQNPGSTEKNITIEQFNNNGQPNGANNIVLAPYASHVYRPRDIVTDGTKAFRGSIIVKETNGQKISGAIKYELHKGAFAYYPVDAITIYRSMGQ